MVRKAWWTAARVTKGVWVEEWVLVGEMLELLWGNSSQLQKVSLINGALLLPGLEARTHLFLTVLNLPILFHLCPVQATRI